MANWHGQVDAARALLLTLVVAGSAVVRGHAGPAPHEARSWAVPKEIRTGDLVLRTGRDMLARMVLTQGDDTRFSHVGMILRENGQTMVIHSVPEDEGHRGGVIVEPLEAFTSQEAAQDIGFYRVGVTTEQAQHALAYAWAQLGKPFDSHFEMASDDAFYCTELVLKALGSAGVQTPDVQGVQVMTLTEWAYPFL